MPRVVNGLSGSTFGSYVSQVVAQPPVPASGVQVANGTGQSYSVVITGGTMTNVSVGGVTVGTGAGTYTVPSGSWISMTYTVAPAWSWVLPVAFVPAKNANGSAVARTGAS